MPASLVAPHRLAAAAVRWHRTGRWTPQALAAALGRLEIVVKSSDNPHFMYVAEGRSDLLADGKRVERRTLRASEFFGARLAEPAPPYLYYTEPVRTLGDGSLLEHAPGWDALVPSDATDEPAWLQLWAGSAGARTQAHYDVADNTFVQMHGEKEFLLWPPSAAAAMHVYPDSHPRARKAQADVEAPDLSRHPNAAALPPPQRVHLCPGDALFVPAFWFHHVRALSPSISLNVFSESPIKRAAAAALAAPPPLHDAWPAPLNRRALEHLLRATFTKIGDGLGEAPPAPAAFVAEMLAARFAPLAAEEDAPADAPQPQGRRRRAPPVPSWDDLEPALDAHAEECASAFARLRDAARRRAAATDVVDAAAADEYAAGVAQLTAAHLVELLALRAFGPARLPAELAALADGTC